MFFDNITDINELGLTLDQLDVQSGPFFPENPEVAQLFNHQTYGLCVYTHNNDWRAVSQIAL